MKTWPVTFVILTLHHSPVWFSSIGKIVSVGHTRTSPALLTYMVYLECFLDLRIMSAIE